MDDPLKSLTYALDKYPERVEMLPLDRLVVESARQNAKRPAYVKLAVPDDLVKSLRGLRGTPPGEGESGGGAGAAPERDLILIVRVPREVLARAESRIVLPGEVR